MRILCSPRTTDQPVRVPAAPRRSIVTGDRPADSRPASREPAEYSAPHGRGATHRLTLPPDQSRAPRSCAARKATIERSALSPGLDQHAGERHASGRMLPSSTRFARVDHVGCDSALLRLIRPATKPKAGFRHTSSYSNESLTIAARKVDDDLPLAGCGSSPSRTRRQSRRRPPSTARTPSLCSRIDRDQSQPSGSWRAARGQPAPWSRPERRCHTAAAAFRAAVRDHAERFPTPGLRLHLEMRPCG